MDATAPARAPASSPPPRERAGDAPTREGFLDTSAQLDKAASEEAREKLQRRARAKYLSTPIIESLLQIGGPMHKSYRRSLDCYSLLEERRGQLTGKRCKSRWCRGCNRIRTAILWDRYRHLLRTSGAPEERDYMVTLTIPNVEGRSLRAAVRKMHARFARIGRRMNGARSRPDLHAIRKTEVTYNPDRDDFHPHLHVIVRGESAALMLLDEWLADSPGASRSAQDVRPLTHEGAAEVFKYFTKLITKSRTDQRRAVRPAALDTIFRALRNLRTVQPYGLFFARQARPEQTDEELMDEGYTASPRAYPGFRIWRWEPDAADWQDPRTGERLSGYRPPKWMRKLVETLESAKDPRRRASPPANLESPTTRRGHARRSDKSEPHSHPVRGPQRD